MRTSIVTDLLFGDGGKGNCVSFLTNPAENILVVRHNGGHQAGHTVSYKGTRHIFSQFGSGALKGGQTFISNYCTFDPVSYNVEYQQIRRLVSTPRIHVDPMAMICTPFDIIANRGSVENVMHGSVGVGFGTTVKRNEESPYKLYAVELKNLSVVNYKLRKIAEYYGIEENVGPMIVMFVDECVNSLSSIIITDFEDAIERCKPEHIIFEGAQGIMLDREFGYFPHVTRSNTTSKNAIEMIQSYELDEPEIWYVMRSYQTRHGFGPMSHESETLEFEDETNVDHEYQGKLRFGGHDPALLSHTLRLDKTFVGSCVKNVIISHLDQTDNMVILGKKPYPVKDMAGYFKNVLDIQKVYLRGSVDCQDTKEIEEYFKKEVEETV